MRVQKPPKLQNGNYKLLKIFQTKTKYSKYNERTIACT